MRRKGRIRRCGQALVASALTLALAAMPFEPALATEQTPGSASTDAPYAAAETEATTSDQVSPLLITEVQTDQPSGKRYTYTEVYNNSDAPINFKDYVFYYCYEGGMGTGKVFGADSSYGKYQYASGDQDLWIQPGKTLVLWQSEGTSGRTVDDFNAFYGTNLVENQDIVRIPYSGIHATAKRGYFFGKSADQVLISAWSNVDGDDIPKGDPDKVAIQYTYSGSGRTCVKSSVSAATPGTVDPAQVPSTPVHVVEQQAQIDSAVADGTNGFAVTAEVPYEGTSATTFVTLHYRQTIGGTESDEQTVEMTSRGDGKTFTASIPTDKLYGDTVSWYVTANGGTGTTVQTDEQTTSITPSMPSADAYPPLYVTEVEANDGAGQYSYFEVYNASDSPINLAYYKILYYYNYPAQTASQSGKVWSLSDYDCMLQPGSTMVYWLTNDGSTVDDFNERYGTSLEEGKSIVKVNYAGLHATDNRWIRFGTSEADAFSLVGFNTSTTGQASTGKAFQYTYPRGENATESVIVNTSDPTPGTVSDWQKAPITAKFQGYANYPADDGEAPTLKVNTTDGFDVPTSINEGDDLRVLYDTDLLLGATSRERSDAFADNGNADNPTNYPGGGETLKDRPYILGFEVLYKLDDASDWTVVKQQSQWRLGHFLMQIPSDVLFGHDKVTYKVRSYSLYGMAETEESTVTINRLQNSTDSVRLNVNDGDLVSGTTTVTANNGGDNSQTSIAVDGTAAGNARMSLENGAYFMVKTSGMDSYFKDAVTAPYGDDPRDIITIMGSWCEAPTSRAIHVDNKYFAYDAATDSYKVDLTIWAGGTGTPFEEIYDEVATANHEDFTVSGLQLVLENGNSYLPTSITPDNIKTNASTALDAVHTVGDSSGMVPHLTASFSIPASDATAMGAQLDTTQLTDGAHTIAATSNGKTTTTNVVVDNTAPAIDFGIDEAKTYYQPFTLDASQVATDANGIKSLDVTLDGNTIQLPSTIDPRALTAGTHTLKAIAIDNAGNLSQASVTFTTGIDNPQVSDVTDGDVASNSADLSVSVDGISDVTFYEGRQLTTDNGGIVAATGQGQTTTSDANGAAPYQLFKLNCGDVSSDDALQINWNGTADAVDSTHPLSLFAYNPTTSAWDSVATADDSGSISARIAGTYAQDGAVYLAVQRMTENVACTAPAPTAEMFVSDGSASSATTPATNAVLSDWDGTGVPENYDFCFAWETDTQYYAESFPYHYDNMNQWIVDHADNLDIRYVLHTGDIVDDFDMTGEWVNADHSMKIFDDTGMPYGVLGGNHDVSAGMEGYGNYWKYFGEDRFADKSYYGGSYKNNLGHYDLLTEDGQDFIVLYMSWDIYTDEINWMNEVLAQHPDRKAIIALHRFTNVVASDQMLDYTGQLLQQEVVAKNPNVFAVLNGHYHGSSMQTDAFDDDGDGVAERTVYQICTDYQSDPEGGSEYIKFLYFDLQNNKIYINSYSPYRNDFNYYDAAKLTNYGVGTHIANQDIAELDVAFNTDAKTLTTSSLSADVQTRDKIGTVENATGTASYTWTGLEPKTQYGWYAVVTNGNAGVTRTPVELFTTEQRTAKVERLSGALSDDTAAAIADRAYEGEKSDYVVISRDDTYYDALSGAGLAGALDAPILLTGTSELSDSCRAAVQSLGATKAVILGGESAVSAQVASELQAMGLSVERVAGDDVYGTSMACTDYLLAHGGSTQYAIACSPASFVDAVSISGWAYANKVPVMLQTWGSSAAERGFDSAAAQVISGRDLIVCGGAGAVSDESVSGLGAKSVTRLGGDTLYDTNMAIVDFELAHGMSASDVTVASDIYSFSGVDALAASALAGRNGGVVLLAQSNPAYEPEPETSTALGFISAHKDEIASVHVLGGEVAQTPEFYQQIEAAVAQA